MTKRKMNTPAARRIQASQDRKGSSGDAGFKSRAMKSVVKTAAKTAAKTAKK